MPLIQTSLFCITPSNSTSTLRPEKLLGSVKCFRNQPTPLGKNAPGPPVRFVSAKGPSMLQSCGRLSLRHAASAKLFCSAPGASPFRNRQSPSNDKTVRAPAVETGGAAGTPADVMARQANIANVNFFASIKFKNMRAAMAGIVARASRPCASAKRPRTKMKRTGETPMPLLLRADPRRRVFQSVGVRLERDFSKLVRPDDDEREAVVGVALFRLKRLEAGRVAIVHGHDFARAFDFKLDVILRARHELALRVGHGHGHKRQIFPIRHNF